jgi:hypothetical protein
VFGPPVQPRETGRLGRMRLITGQWGEAERRGRKSIGSLALHRLFLFSDSLFLILLSGR